MTSSAVFDKQKGICLSGVDLSRKGSIDLPIQPLITFINSEINYFTTSSCSGRIIVVDNENKGTCSIKKQGCKWILTSHDCITIEELITKMCDVGGNAVFKFEPFVMHVQCRAVEDARILLSCGVASGYRNSGISIGNKGKYITAIRSTHSLEVPISCDGKILVTKQYLSFIVDLANSKMRENFAKIDRFFENLKSALSEASKSNVVKDRSKKTKTKKADDFYKDTSSKRGEVTRKQEDVSTVSHNSIDDCDINAIGDCGLFDGDFVT